VQCGGTPIAAGAPISLVQCSSEVGPRPGPSWDFLPLAPAAATGVFSLRAQPALCIAAVPSGSAWPVILAPCNSSDINQQWSLNYSTPYSTSISNVPSGRCLDVFNADPEVGAAIDAWPCHGQQFMYDYLPGEIVDINDVVCLGIC